MNADRDESKKIAQSQNNGKMKFPEVSNCLKNFCRSHKKALIILGAVLTAVFIFLVICFFVFPFGKKSEMPQSHQSVTTPIPEINITTTPFEITTTSPGNVTEYPQTLLPLCIIKQDLHVACTQGKAKKSVGSFRYQSAWIRRVQRRMPRMSGNDFHRGALYMLAN
uniref:Uncharacterized protein n=1 Tax=Panagrolaimus sp. JU765 TaxID=591449 RepID=A0AC34QAC5_9BILA